MVVIQLVAIPQKPQFDSITTDNIDIDNFSTAIQPQLENQQQIPQQSLLESQSVESLPTEENIQSSLLQKPNQNQNIIQSQLVESSSSNNRVENDSLVSENENQITQPQIITNPQQPQFDSTTTDNIDVENSSTAIQPQLENQQQNQDVIQSQSVESQPRENRVENDSTVESAVSKKSQNTDIDVESAIVHPQLEEFTQNIQPKSQSSLAKPSSLQRQTESNYNLSEQKINNIKSTISNKKLDDYKSELPQIIQSNPIDIQPRLDNQSLPISKSLTKLSPLAQESDFLISKLETEFSYETPFKSDSNTSNIRLTEDEAQAKAKANNFNGQSNNLKSSGDTPEKWSNISELLSLTPQSLAAKDNLLLRNFHPESESSPQQPQIDSFNQEYNNLLSSNTTEEIPDEWSNISQLIGENNKLESENNLVSTSIETEKPSIQLVSPFSSTSPNPKINDSNITSEEITQNYTKKDDYIDEKQLEIMAQQVYSILQQRLEIDCEREGKKSGMFQSHFNESTNTQQQDEVNLPLDNQLQTLAQEVYFMLRLRMEIEKER